VLTAERDMFFGRDRSSSHDAKEKNARENVREKVVVTHNEREKERHNARENVKERVTHDVRERETQTHEKGVMGKAADSISATASRAGGALLGTVTEKAYAAKDSLLVTVSEKAAEAKEACFGVNRDAAEKANVSQELAHFGTKEELSHFSKENVAASKEREKTRSIDDAMNSGEKTMLDDRSNVQIRRENDKQVASIGDENRDKLQNARASRSEKAHSATEPLVVRDKENVRDTAASMNRGAEMRVDKGKAEGRTPREEAVKKVVF